MIFHAVISDLDGVIVNSEAEHFLSFQKMLRLDYHLNFTEGKYKEFLGTTDEYVFTSLKKQYPQIIESMDLLIRRRTQIYLSIFKKKAKVLPGVKSLFKYVRSQKIPLALGTSASLEIATYTLAALKLAPFFKTIVSADDVTSGKPAPDIYLEISRRLNVAPEKCLVLEDSNYGVQAAKAAGMKCIAIPCGPTLKQDLSLADHIVKSLSDITPQLLDSFR